MEKLYDLKESLMDGLKQFDTVKEGRLKMGELEALNLLTDTVKNVDKICMLEEEGGYSSAVDSDYGRGSSYANRGQHYVRGHYSRDGRGGQDGGYSSRRDGRGRYSRDDGRSEMMEHLEMALDSATDRDRENIKRFMRELENG